MGIEAYLVILNQYPCEKFIKSSKKTIVRSYGQRKPTTCVTKKWSLKD